jgi:hypothetical protein
MFPWYLVRHFAVWRRWAVSSGYDCATARATLSLLACPLPVTNFLTIELPGLGKARSKLQEVPRDLGSELGLGCLAEPDAEILPLRVITHIAG